MPEIVLEERDLVLAQIYIFVNAVRAPHPRRAVSGFGGWGAINFRVVWYRKKVVWYLILLIIFARIFDFARACAGWRSTDEVCSYYHQELQQLK